MLFSKKNKKEKEPEFYTSAVNRQTINYRVYYMKPMEKILYFLLAFAAGALVGFLFYGGIGKDEFGNSTTLTTVLNILIPGTVGVIAGSLFIPIRTQQIIKKRTHQLKVQFRDMLDSLNTSLGAGKNVVDSFKSVYEDLKVQYNDDTYILSELELVLIGLSNNIDLEDLLMDFGKRSGIPDIESFANVFKISYRKGGNIKDVIRNTNIILTEKMEIEEEIETIVSSSKMEQKIMIVMPIALIGIIKGMSPDFAKNFVTPSGLISTTIAIGLFVAAYYVGKNVMEIKI